MSLSLFFHHFASPYLLINIILHRGMAFNQSPGRPHAK
jgi:hypothetical protein